MAFDKAQLPASGEKITVNDDFSLNVPNRPIIPYIEGDGIGVDISPVMKRVVDAAVAKGYDGERGIEWMEIYAGVEWAAGTEEVKKVIDFLQNEMGVTKIRFPESSGIGIKPVSEDGTKRLVRKAIQYAIDNDRDSVTLVHKGNIMKFTEGAFKNWGYELAKAEFGAVEIDGGPWCSFKTPNTGKEIIIKDSIADAFLQQILLRPAEYDVIATHILMAIMSPTPWPPRSAVSASPPAPTSPTRWRCSRRPTAPRPNMPARIRSTPAPSSSPPR